MAKLTPWTDPGLPEAVEYDSDELEIIRRRAIDGLLSLPKVGMGVGGFLLGSRDSGVIRILGSQEIFCSHAFGPGFRLTDQEIVAAVPAGGQPAGLRVVGWYCSKPRAKAELTEEDKKLFRALCPLPWQIALSIVPSTVDVTRAALFTQEAEGGALLPLVEAEPGATPREVVPLVEQAVPPSPMLAAELPRPAPTPQRPLFAVSPARRPNRLPRWIMAAALCLFTVWGAFASRDFWWPQPKLELRSFDSGDALTIEWNSRAVKGIDGGLLEIRDGPESQVYALTPSQLRAGTMHYPRKTGRVWAVLHAGRVEESVAFSGPPPAAVTR